MRAQFDDFVFDSGTRELLRGGRPVALSPRAFDLLHVLLESRPRVVTTEEIQERVWAGTHVESGNVRRVMNEVRAALGDAAREPRYVRTAHGHGYAFMAEARDSEEPAGRSASCWIERGSWRQPLGEGTHLLGRDPDAAIPLASTQASRKHARIHVREGRAELEDLGSKNGTLVDGELVEARVALRNRARIQIGEETLVFCAPATGEATETAGPR